jgi:hypothetical protein
MCIDADYFKSKTKEPTRRWKAFKQIESSLMTPYVNTPAQLGERLEKSGEVPSACVNAPVHYDDHYDEHGFTVFRTLKEAKKWVDVERDLIDSMSIRAIIILPVICSGFVAGGLWDVAVVQIEVYRKVKLPKSLKRAYKLERDGTLTKVL